MTTGTVDETDRRIRGAGTDEAAWRSCTRLDTLPECDLRAWARAYRRIWIIAPHPDDEVLGLGAAVVELSRLGAALGFICVTDGEASHPGSPRWTEDTLRSARRDELRRALDVLGVEAEIVRLRIPDGRVATHRGALLDGLIERIGADDLMLVTWRRDGHPDYEACAEVARQMADIIGAALVEYPVWMWHWADVDEASIPWSRARRLTASRSARERKTEAVAQFVSQVTSDATHDAVLPRHVLVRFERPFEVVFV